MSIDQLAVLLTGTAGGLVLSLLLNLLFWQGRLTNPKRTVPREDYDAAIAAGLKATTAVELLTATVADLGTKIAALSTRLSRQKRGTPGDHR